MNIPGIFTSQIKQRSAEIKAQTKAVMRGEPVSADMIQRANAAAVHLLHDIADFIRDQERWQEKELQKACEEAAAAIRGEVA